MSPDKCALYAQVTPVFVLAILAEGALWTRGPNAKRNPMWALAGAFVSGCVSTYLALTAGDGGAGPVRTTFIEFGATACIGIAALLGAVRIAEWQPAERRWHKPFGRDEPDGDRRGDDDDD